MRNFSKLESVVALGKVIAERHQRIAHDVGIRAAFPDSTGYVQSAPVYGYRFDAVNTLTLFAESIFDGHNRAVNARAAGMTAYRECMTSWFADIYRWGSADATYAQQKRDRISRLNWLRNYAQRGSGYTGVLQRNYLYCDIRKVRENYAGIIEKSDQTKVDRCWRGDVSRENLTPEQTKKYDDAVADTLGLYYYDH